MKNIYFQKIRGILIFFVLFIHCMYESSIPILNYIFIAFRTLCNVAVPIFIFLSAYFFNIDKYKKNPKKYIFLRIKRLLIPLLIWNAVYFILDFDSLSLIEFITFATAPQLYFILVLIQLTLLTPFLIKTLHRPKIKYCLYMISPIFLLLQHILIMNFEYRIPFHGTLFFGWLIYYLFGLESKFKNFGDVKTATVILTWGGGSFI